MKLNPRSFGLSLLMLYILHHQQVTAQLHKRQKVDNVVAEMQVLCRSDAIILKVNTNTPFNGMVYARDAPTSNNCVAEYNAKTNMTFKLPLKSCGTLSADADDGIEYFNTVVVQPHMRLMTNQGKGYHIRCKYQTRERTIANTHFNVSASFMMANSPQSTSTPLLATASMPSCTMKIFRSGRDDVAEAVKIGDKLIMVIEIDQQDMYGMKITNCVVRDGLNLAEQALIDDSGCPVDENIMPKFEYTNNSTRAAVSFPAHKFPHTSSVYYQCNVRLCINNGGCSLAECNSTSANNNNNNNNVNIISNNSSGGPRRKRMAAAAAAALQHEQQAASKHPTSEPLGVESAQALPVASALVAPRQRQTGSSGISKEGGANMSFDVYSGLYVSDADISDSGSSDTNAQQVLPPSRRSNLDSSEDICLTFGQTSLMLLTASLTTAGVALLLACQLGSFGREQQVSANKLFSTSTCSSSGSSASNSRFPNERNCRLESSRTPHQIYQYHT